MIWNQQWQESRRPSDCQIISWPTWTQRHDDRESALAGSSRTEWRNRSTSPTRKRLRHWMRRVAAWKWKRCLITTLSISRITSQTYERDRPLKQVQERPSSYFVSAHTTNSSDYRHEIKTKSHPGALALRTGSVVGFIDAKVRLFSNKQTFLPKICLKGLKSASFCIWTMQIESHPLLAAYYKNTHKEQISVVIWTIIIVSYLISCLFQKKQLSLQLLHTNCGNK